MIKPLIIANWKSNPDTLGAACRIAEKIEQIAAHNKNVQVVLAPPMLYLAPLVSLLRRTALGAQNLFWTSGAYTGEVSPTQLCHIGVKYSIVGHSERRAHLAESDEMVHKKLHAALAHGMTAILCVGEKERTQGEISERVEEQLQQALKGIKKNQLANMIVAYEPVWAISTTSGAAPDTPDNAFRMAIFLKKILVRRYDRKSAERVRIIYGGSVRATNIVSFLREGTMAGALVGGASLDISEFSKIVQRAANHSR